VFAAFAARRVDHTPKLRQVIWPVAVPALNLRAYLLAPVPPVEQAGKAGCDAQRTRPLPVVRALLTVAVFGPTTLQTLSISSGQSAGADETSRVYSLRRPLPQAVSAAVSGMPTNT